jgi:AcrR family transcriptional regulator
MAGRMSRRHAAGRTEVLDRAAHAIAQRGYHGMSMRDLARATGRGLASFYTLFGSKEDILYHLQKHALATLTASAERAVAGDSDPRERLFLFVLNHVRYFAERPDVMRVLVQEAASLAPGRRAEIRAQKEQYFAIAEGVLRFLVRDAACGSGSYPTAVEIERMTYSFFGMLNWIYGWYDPERHGSPDELAITIHRMTLCGVDGMFAQSGVPTATSVRKLDEVDRPPLIISFGGRSRS